MSISGFFKGLGAAISVLFHIIATICESLVKFSEEVEKNLTGWENDRTFSDLRQAIEFVAEGRGMWADVNNGIQYEWLLEHGEFEGHKVTANVGRVDDILELSFDYEYKGKVYSVHILPRHTKHRFSVHVIESQKTLR